MQIPKHTYTEKYNYTNTKTYKRKNIEHLNLKNMQTQTYKRKNTKT